MRLEQVKIALKLNWECDFFNRFCLIFKPWSSSRKKPSREEREAMKQRKKEEKKSREDEKRQKREEKKKTKDRKKIDKYFESRQKRVNNFNYFTQPLESVCDPGTLVPVFVDKCIDFVENTGMSRKQHLSSCHKVPILSSCHRLPKLTIR